MVNEEGYFVLSDTVSQHRKTGSIRAARGRTHRGTNQQVPPPPPPLAEEECRMWGRKEHRPRVKRNRLWRGLDNGNDRQRRATYPQALALDTRKRRRGYPAALAEGYRSTLWWLQYGCS
ncbi:hypothetical protein L202_06297 [Cryptococcus amylolentus CBS 6039]|uniref:Uncharacterized protein n=1 Tax=Cryptococcus amylolentus CBS 6039 TaxID=1295533 RepID=A0A1E3HFF9_9TREE|nr:hypothetical protein L202_06297 [Cryptococcus amylolentus CBS 6039]ODN75080.1 hypothetical protein L202_06297 [Cryptococcus amylolentus CBS 6039]